MIGRLLGHLEIATTARYAHFARASVHEAAARVAEGIPFASMPAHANQVTAYELPI